MRKILCAAPAALLAVMMSSCLSAKQLDEQQVMYDWDNYSEVTYNYVMGKDKKSRAEMMTMYESIIVNGEDSISGRVPPGVYADYGYMLVEQGNEIEGVEYLKKEIELYPSSEPFLRKIIVRIEDNNLGGAYDEDKDDEE